MMEQAENWARIKELFTAAAELDSDQQEAFLRNACGADNRLFAEVNTLLAAHRNAGSLSDSPWQRRTTGEIRVPEAIGPYRLVRELGEGGMGQVWLAEQTSPVRRQVAIKFVRPGIFNSSLLQRFQWERQSLAMMDHPAIAKIFEAGSTPAGEPYLVMEYVPGLPITDYCDGKKLTIPERLQLFILACEGVQHAHQKAIVHRDLKPANILVVEVDGHPMPRVIDFGLAKTAVPLVDDQTVLQTQIGSFLGTPGYMSPEQADPGVEDIDTRTDVYSQGVILYVLLTGFLPFEVKGKPVHEVVRQLREQDPPRPSTRIETVKDATAQATARGTDPGSLRTVLKGDLGWIAMKALEKDRERRYQTPLELAADIRRFLNNEPIMARPVSATYQLKKYIRRHRVGASFAVAMVLVLATFTVIQARQLRRITRERDRADHVTEYMANMFNVSRPSEARGNTITAREVLDKASKNIDSDLAKDPELQAQMMMLMARVYGGLGLYARSEALATQAANIRTRVLGPEHPQTLDVMSTMEWAISQQGRFKEAEKLERETLAIKLRVLGKNNNGTARSMDNLANSLFGQTRFAEAEDLRRQALEIRRRVLRPDDPETIGSMAGLAAIFSITGRPAEAEKLEREVLDIRRRVLGNDHPDTLVTINILASTLLHERRFLDAEKQAREAIDIEGRVLGNDHPQTLEAMSLLASALTEQGRYSEEEIVLRKILDSESRVYPNSLPLVLNNLGVALLRQGRYAEAEKWIRQGVEKSSSVLGPEHPQTALYVYNLACVEALGGKRDAAIRDLNHAVEHGLAPYALRTIGADPDLKPLHGDPRFTQLVAVAKERAPKD